MTDKEEDTPKRNWVMIGIFAIVILILLIVISSIGLSTEFWILFFVVAILIAIYFVMNYLRNREVQFDINQVLLTLQDAHGQLPNGDFLDVSKYQVRELSQNSFLVNFPNQGVVYEVRDNIVKGLEYSELHIAAKEREKAKYYEDIVAYGKEKGALIERAKELGQPVPEVDYA